MPPTTTSNPLTPHREGMWSLQEFVDLVNELLPAYLPKEATGRVADEVNPRLVRHYTTQGLLPEPRREGREARYLFEHLLAALVVRRLLAEGFSSGAIKQVLEGRSPEQLEALLDGGLRIELVPDSAVPDPGGRSAFLAQVRQRAGLDPAEATDEVQARRFSSPRTAAPPAQPATQQPSEPFRESTWTRIDLLDGLELLVRDDFQLPASRLGDEQLTQLLKVVLLQLEQKRRGKQ